MPCKGPQTGATAIERGNRLADAEAKGAAEWASESQILALVPETEKQALTKVLENEVEDSEIDRHLRPDEYARDLWGK